MKLLDRVLQRWRIEKARPYLRPGDEVLDVGSADGALFRVFSFLGPGVGVDPHVEPGAFPSNARAVRGIFPDDLPEAGPFDAITLMAMLEHVPEAEQPALASACAERLRPGGVVLVTVPSPQVDRILDVLMAARLVDGMEVGQHYGFPPERTVPLFEGAGLRCVEKQPFQLGLNSFFAFKKP